MEKILKVLQFAAILGIPTIFAMFAWILKRIKGYSKQMRVLMNAQQAQMRSQLLRDYYYYTRRGYVYEAELADWENQYQAYHSLGANGIMDKRRERLLELEVKEEIP